MVTIYGIELPEQALSVRQPWAWAIIHAGKDIENRTWQTDFRGRIAIHAGMKYKTGGDEHLSRRFDITVPTDIARGGIIGTVELVDCVTSSPSRWFEGPYGFVLRDPRPTAFLPMPGKLGIFRLKG